MLGYALSIIIMLSLLAWLVYIMRQAGKDSATVEQQEEILDDIYKANVARERLKRIKYAERVRKKFTRR